MSLKKHAMFAGLVAPFVVMASSAFAVDKPLDFVTKASQAGLFEIKSSQLALKRSKNPEVLHFAHAMITDHTKAATSLKTAAHATRLVPAKELNPDYQAKLDDLAKKHDDFDKSYINAQDDAHHDAVNLFDDFSKNGKERHLKTFAEKTLPTLQMHLDKVEAIKAKM